MADQPFQVGVRLIPTSVTAKAAHERACGRSNQCIQSIVDLPDGEERFDGVREAFRGALERLDEVMR